MVAVVFDQPAEGSVRQGDNSPSVWFSFCPIGTKFCTGQFFVRPLEGQVGERRFVFLPVKDNDGSFALREVRLGSAAGGYYSVLEGVKVQEEVVTDGSFILKAEALRQHPELH